MGLTTSLGDGNTPPDLTKRSKQHGEEQLEAGHLQSRSTNGLGTKRDVSVLLSQRT